MLIFNSLYLAFVAIFKSFRKLLASVKYLSQSLQEFETVMVIQCKHASIRAGVFQVLRSTKAREGSRSPHFLLHTFVEWYDVYKEAGKYFTTVPTFLLIPMIHRRIKILLVRMYLLRIKCSLKISNLIMKLCEFSCTVIFRKCTSRNLS